MIELTEQQLIALQEVGQNTYRVMNPQTKETYILLPVCEYERLKEDEYDDTPWTKDELQALAWEAGKNAGWQGLDDYDDPAENRVKARRRDIRVRFPHPSGLRGKKRPAVIVQSDTYAGRVGTFVVAEVTKNVPHG